MCVWLGVFTRLTLLCILNYFFEIFRYLNPDPRNGEGKYFQWDAAKGLMTFAS